MCEIVLASASPRRSELLAQLGLDFKVEASEVEENLEKGISPAEAVERLAFKKAEDVSTRNFSKVVIGADTVVVNGSSIMGKPSDEDEAFSMLAALSGRQHKVLTGVAIIHGEKKRTLIDHAETEVFFKRLSPDEIWGYIATGEPFDKAGGYGIQGKGAVLVEKIHGCYFNVVGLPVSLLADMLKQFHINVFGGKHE